MKRIKKYTLLVIVMMMSYNTYSQSNPPFCTFPQNIDTTHLNHECYNVTVYVKDIQNKVHTLIEIKCDKIINVVFESTESCTSPNNKYISWKIWKQKYQLRK